jgi:hypothetical protein
MTAVNPPASAQRSMVNWDVVGHEWHRLTDRARSEWNRIASR